LLVLGVGSDHRQLIGTSLFGGGQRLLSFMLHSSQD
jgi:hypothetical protein